jgi:hypothetical protein
MATIRLRMPDDLHDTFKERADKAGVSLEDYLRAEICRIAERPTPEELRERVARRSKLDEGSSSA